MFYPLDRIVEVTDGPVESAGLLRMRQKTTYLMYDEYIFMKAACFRKMLATDLVTSTDN